MIRLFFDLCFYFCREFQKSGPTEENWWIKCTMDPPSFGMDSKVGPAMVGSALLCKKKIRFNLLKISSKFVGHEMMRCPIYSPTNIAYMSWWMAKIQFKPNKEEEKLQKKIKPRRGRPCILFQESHTPSGVHMHSKIAHQIWFSDLEFIWKRSGAKWRNGKLPKEFEYFKEGCKKRFDERN